MTDNNKRTPQALITGGSGDLAAVMALKLQDRGYDVLCPDKCELDVRDGDSVDSFFDLKVTKHLALLSEWNCMPNRQFLPKAVAAI